MWPFLALSIICGFRWGFFVTANLLDGKKIAHQELEQLQEEVESFIATNGRPPGLAVVQMGNDSASTLYVRKKRQTCESLGIRSFSGNLDVEAPEGELLELIDGFNRDPEIDGILVQLPLPAHVSTEAVIDRIELTKDVDGFHPSNMGCLLTNRPALRPCTPRGVMRMLGYTGEPLAGKHAVIVGRSNLVGRPVAIELLNARATITVCHTATSNLAEKVQQAEIVVATAGQPHLVRGDWIREGAIVIDVGINRLPDGSLCGDVEFETARERATWISPVPGGVGPMTVATLMRNTLEAANHVYYHDLGHLRQT